MSCFAYPNGHVFKIQANRLSRTSEPLLNVSTTSNDDIVPALYEWKKKQEESTKKWR
jgi:hypothetical protein